MISYLNNFTRNIKASLGLNISTKSLLNVTRIKNEASFKFYTPKGIKKLRESILQNRWMFKEILNYDCKNINLSNFELERSLSEENKSDDEKQLEVRAVSLIDKWVTEFLNKPNPLLFRTGEVCPYINIALMKSSIYYSVHRTKIEKETEKIKTILEQMSEIFWSLESTKNENIINKALILIFPDIKIKDTKGMIDEVQDCMKLKFVSKGLMLGEFHILNETSSLRNKNFFPLRAPIPSLAVRKMVLGDIQFLMHNKYSVDRKIQYLTYYIKNFEIEKSENAKQYVRKAKKEILEISKNYDSSLKITESHKK